MSLAATLSAGGARPASFLPTIKCSDCSEQIEISAMGEHLCGDKATASAHSSIASTSSNGSSASSNGNPFALRTANANPSKPATPSPLQFDSSASKPPQTRVRAPTLGSSQPSKPSRPALPRINPETANRPFLAPVQRPESPISPALSSRSGNSFGPKPPPLRSMTSPAGPRIFDPRPPSPELSANLDCAFPPFLPPSSAGSRPSTSNGRKTPNSDRAPSRGGGSRQDGRWPAEKEGFDLEPKSPRTNGGDVVFEKMNTLMSGPFDASKRRPSRDERQDHGPVSSHGRRPSMPQNPPAEPLPSLPSSRFAASSKPSPAGERAHSPERKGSGDKKMPPQRPVRPPTQECPSPSFLGQFSDEPSSIAPANPASTDQPPSMGGADRSKTFPLPTERATSPALSTVRSEPELRGRQRRPTLNGASKSEPSQVPQVSHPPRSQSRNGDRVDHRLDNAPPVPKPVQQLNRSNSQHRPSGSGSSTTSSLNSISNTNSSAGGPSPIGSAASSIDALSPLNFETEPYGDDKGMRVAGLNLRHQKPGMRAELPREKKSPPRDFSRPMLPNEPFVPPPGESQQSSGSGAWPLEAPMESPLDPEMMMTHPSQRSGVGPVQQTAPARSMTTSNVRVAPSALSIPERASGDYDPFKPNSPLPGMSPQQQPRSHARARSKTNIGPVPRVPSPQHAPMPRSQTSRPAQRPFSPPQASTPTPRRPAQGPFSPALSGPPPHHPVQRPFNPPPAGPPPQQAAPPPSKTALRPLQPPPIPQEGAPRPHLARRQTSGKAICRGCDQQIEGKSVKAADGRLTGRWHKACFVCRTCTQPFTTADFYVIDNQPFCEHHYHEANGSLCAGCTRGIEGQYLETSGQRGDRKFHPRCFTCVDCRVVLSDDYFEIAGRVFCERHALANMRSQARMAGGPGAPGGRAGPGGGLHPPGRNPLTAAKRTTRLMMMV